MRILRVKITKILLFTFSLKIGAKHNYNGLLRIS